MPYHFSASNRREAEDSQLIRRHRLNSPPSQLDERSAVLCDSLLSLIHCSHLHVDEGFNMIDDDTLSSLTGKEHQIQRAFVLYPRQTAVSRLVKY